MSSWSLLGAVFRVTVWAMIILLNDNKCKHISIQQNMKPLSITTELIPLCRDEMTLNARASSCHCLNIEALSFGPLACFKCRDVGSVCMLLWLRRVVLFRSYNEQTLIEGFYKKERLDRGADRIMLVVGRRHYRQRRLRAHAC